MYGGQGLFYPLSSSGSNQFSAAVIVNNVSPTQFNVLPSASGFAQTLTVSGLGLSTADVYYAVGANQVCTGTGASSVSFPSGLVSVLGFGTSVSVVATFSANSPGLNFRLCVMPGGNPAVSAAGLVPVGALTSTISAVSSSGFSPVAFPAVNGLVMTIYSNGFPLAANAVAISVVLGGACVAGVAVLPVSNVLSTSVDTQVTFTVAAASAAAGSSWTVCLAAGSGGSGNAVGAGAVIVGGVGGQLAIANAVSISPLGLAVSSLAVQSLLTVSGVALASSDVIKLVPYVISPSSACTDVDPGTHVYTTYVSTIAASGSLVVATNTAITSGSAFLVCVQYRQTGLFYLLSGTSSNRFSAVVASGVAPLQYAFSGQSAGVRTLTVAGSGLTERDVYYAVAASQTCTGTMMTSISFSSYSSVVFNSAVQINAVFVSSSGRPGAAY